VNDLPDARPFNFVCQKWGHTIDFYNICPKCKSKMERKELAFLDRLFG